MNDFLKNISKIVNSFYSNSMAMLTTKKTTIASILLFFIRNFQIHILRRFNRLI